MYLLTSLTVSWASYLPYLYFPITDFWSDVEFYIALNPADSNFQSHGLRIPQISGFPLRMEIYWSGITWNTVIIIILKLKLFTLKFIMFYVSVPITGYNPPDIFWYLSQLTQRVSIPVFLFPMFITLFNLHMSIIFSKILTMCDVGPYSEKKNSKFLLLSLFFCMCFIFKNR